MKSGLPDWKPYDPAVAPSELPFDNSSHMVVLLATPAAESQGWAPSTAVSMARHWAGKGERVVLADLGLERPKIHEELDLPNGEGVSDAFLYGASLPRVARAAEGGFFFASAGTPVVNGRRVLDSPRWEQFVHGFARAGARLLVYLPSDAAGRESPLARADEVVLLATEDERNDVSEATAAAHGFFPPGSAAAETATSTQEPVSTPSRPARAPRPADDAYRTLGETSPSSGRGRMVLIVLLVIVVIVALMSVLGMTA